MCPFCFAMAAQIAVGVASTGGLTALLIKGFHSKNIGAKLTAGLHSKENQHVS
jgi:hypothetical protein